MNALSSGNYGTFFDHACVDYLVGVSVRFVYMLSFDALESLMLYLCSSLCREEQVNQSEENHCFP